MGRAIKFRGMVDGEMIYQDSAHSFNIRAGGDAECLHWLGFDLIGVATVDNLMQFTGLKDKNGIDIYEGDIVCIEYKWMEHIEKGKPYPVEFSDCDVSVQWSVCDVPIIAFNFGGSLLATDENYEVIGNIYQNPELLHAT